MSTFCVLARPRMWFCVGPPKVPPRSECTPRPRVLLSTRPPTRLRASSTVTEYRGGVSPRAAVSPAKPAPTMATSTVREPRLRFFLRVAASSATAPAAPDSSSPRRVIGWSCGPIRGREASIAPPMLDALREEVAAASRRLAADGLVLGTAGNLSAREGEQVAITPTGAHLSKLDADQVCVID